MPVLEQALETPFGKTPTEDPADRSEWQLVLDVVGEDTFGGTSGRHDVSVNPLRKGAFDHLVGKHLPGFVGDVLRDHLLPERADLDPQNHSRSHFERGGGLKDLGLLPRGLKSLERIRSLVECKDRFGACLDDTFLHEAHSRLSMGTCGALASRDRKRWAFCEAEYCSGGANAVYCPRP